MPSKSIAPRAPRTDLAQLDKQLADEVSNISTMISASGSPRISIDRSGHFVGPDGLDLGTEIRVIVIDFVSKNQLYTSAYDPNNPVPPVCVAVGKVLADMKPDPASPEPCWTDCATCPKNQWGSRGKGKACKNTRELAVILEEDAEEESPKLYHISVPPTAISSFDAFANLCKTVLNGPPIKAIVTVKAVSKGAYTTMQFADPDNNEFYANHIALRAEGLAMISQIPDMSNYVPTKGYVAPAGTVPCKY